MKPLSLVVVLALMLINASVVLSSLTFLGVSTSWAADEMVSFDTPQQRELFTALTHEYRCLKCQNQTIADSNADLAGDLRREIHNLVLEGNTREQIDAYLLQRYGDFILYKPRLTSNTLVLWFAPFVLMLGGLAFALVTAARKKRLSGSVSEDKLEKARSLLKND